MKFPLSLPHRLWILPPRRNYQKGAVLRLRHPSDKIQSWHTFRGSAVNDLIASSKPDGKTHKHSDDIPSRKFQENAWTFSACLKAALLTVYYIFSWGLTYPYLNDGWMLEESRVTHKPNIVYLQFKLLSTHVGFGGQDGGEDDVREP